MTITDLAKVTGIGVSTINNYELKDKKISLPYIRILSRVLDIPIAFLGGFENLPEDTLGQKTKKARLFHGFSKSEFARLIGVNVKTLRSWENDINIPLPIHMNNLKLFLNT